MLTKMKEKKENLSSKTTTVNHTSMMPMSNEKQMFADNFFFSHAKNEGSDPHKDQLGANIKLRMKKRDQVAGKSYKINSILKLEKSSLIYSVRELLQFTPCYILFGRNMALGNSLVLFKNTIYFIGLTLGLYRRKVLWR